MSDHLANGKAYFSHCFRYRYMLLRSWGDGPACSFIMLNPSTADASKDDPTIRRCMSFARREGCGSLVVFNLFAFRATSPADMKAAADPIGEENDDYLQMLMKRDEGPIIAAWGAHGSFLDRDKVVKRMFTGRLQCLGKTKSGAPKHPLYIKSDAPLIQLDD